MTLGQPDRLLFNWGSLPHNSSLFQVDLKTSKQANTYPAQRPLFTQHPLAVHTHLSFPGLRLLHIHSLFIHYSLCHECSIASSNANIRIWTQYIAAKLSSFLCQSAILENQATPNAAHSSVLHSPSLHVIKSLALDPSFIFPLPLH